jgi:hypothetical protein
MAACEVEVGHAVQWFGEQLFEPNEQRQIFMDRLRVGRRVPLRTGTLRASQREKNA